MLRDRPLVGDREFCHESYFEDLEQEGLQYVIRLNTESNVRITHQPGEKAAQVSLQLAPGQTRYVSGVYYRGTVKMNLAGTWQEGCREPLWVAANIEAKPALQIYLSRMKIEESFRDLKNLLHVDEVLSKTRKNMEKLILLMLIVYTIGVLVGEKVRDQMFPGEKEMEPLIWPSHSA
jgi:transposase